MQHLTQYAFGAHLIDWAGLVMVYLIAAVLAKLTTAPRKEGR